MKVIIAYSGGMDSHVLLHALAQVKKYCAPSLDLLAIHINHNLSQNAKQWEEHCKQVCKDLSIEIIIKRVNANIKIKDKSPEEIARDLRYAAFAEILFQDAIQDVILVTAHHADDQAETLLLRLFHGAGVNGLSAMAVRVKFANSWLVRPLLSYSREELLEYAVDNNLSWIEDESNADIKYSRNLIRHEIMPLLKKNWPGVVTTINRAAENCAWASELLENIAKTDLELIGQVNLVVADFNFYGLNIELFKKLDLQRQYNLIRFWLKQLNLPMPSRVKLQEIFRTVINSKNDSDPLVSWSGAEVRRFAGYIYAMKPLSSHDNTVIISLYGNFTLRFRQGGEVLKMPKRNGTHELKKLMQEWKIPPWLRDRIPLIYCDDELIAIIGYYNAYEDKKSA